VPSLRMYGAKPLPTHAFLRHGTYLSKGMLNGVGLC